MGGKPAFDSLLHVGRPHIGDQDRFLELIKNILERRRFTNDGPYVRELEHRIADQLGVKHCLLVCNGTVALQIAIRALDLSGEVIVPAWTFVAPIHALQWQGLKPVFCDVDPKSHTLDPKAAERLITSNTSAILGVHVWGQPCAIRALADIASRRNLRLLYDAAHAFACSYRGRMVGGFGDAEVFSFHATKFFHTLEGGAITTNSDETADRVRLIRNFGFAGVDNVASLGINGKMNETSAAMGLTLLDDLDLLIAHNRRNYRQYQGELADLPGLGLFAFDESEHQNYQYIVLEIDPETTHVKRNMLVDVLRAENVLARRYFSPGCHRMEPYRSRVPPQKWNLTVTERLAEEVLCLPTGSSVGTDEISQICQIIRVAIRHASELTNVRPLRHAV